LVKAFPEGAVKLWMVAKPETVLEGLNSVLARSTEMLPLLPLAI